MVRLLSDFLQRSKVKVTSTSKPKEALIGRKDTVMDQDNLELRAPSSRIKKSPEKFEFGASHVLFSEATKKHEDKIKNRNYQKVFKEKKNRKKKECGLKEKKNMEKKIQKLSESDKISKKKIKALQIENKKLKKKMNCETK